ncbi:MAG TPA: hypothetical protein VGR57_14325, partial [Ktedonobacterales bacterium]|nr:hypothetical protein [Ktedonobacterales bacterium]
EALPSHIHLVLATRADPPFPLARLRARGQLVEVRAPDLRFDDRETADYLQSEMGIELSAADLATLLQRTEGWIAGLQLAALSLRGRSDISTFLAAFSGSHRFVLDYLSEEVFARQPAAVQRFLIRTAVLERLTGPLCDAVTGREDGQAQLESLERANLFVVALDDERHWYRYHHLMRDVLRSRLQHEQPALVPELHRRAGACYLREGLVGEAIHHLLSAGDVARVAEVLEEQGFALVATQESIQATHGWLSALPESLLRARPRLCLLRAITLMFTNHPWEAEDLLQAAEALLTAETPAEEAALIRGYAATTRANLAGFAGNVPHAVTFAEQALELLPANDVLMRSAARMVAAHRYFLDGDVAPAREQLVAEVAALVRASGNPLIALNMLAALGRLYVFQGRLRQGATVYGAVAELIGDPETLAAIPGSAAYYFGLGEILREWNELAEAERLLSESIRQVRGPFAVPHEVVAQGYMGLARVQLGRGDYAAARETLRAFAQLALEQPFLPDQEAHRAAIAALAELAAGHLEEPVRWAAAREPALVEGDL